MKVDQECEDVAVGHRVDGVGQGTPGEPRVDFDQPETVLADADGSKVNTYAYSPRGVRILAQSSEPVAQPYRFAGNFQDPTGLCHLQARYYDANIGRFTQPDPSGQEKNPYTSTPKATPSTASIRRARST
ncbi:RHS repeat-associated core domain-containing protein [Streptomyces sp. NPDC002566]|uniref:RHS repeat-associated core domain-containing protein n=1 Tax=Streptomyces sp. NPDC002566 TaxID=3364650 RepID=UPI00369580B2